MFPRRRIQDVAPPTTALRHGRGEYYGRLRAWDRALADFDALGLDALPQRAALLLHKGNTAAYQQLLTEALAAPASTDVEGLTRLSRPAVLAPLPEAAAEKAVVLASRLRTALPRHRFTLTCHGLALLRIGSLAEARITLETAQKAFGGPSLAAFSSVALSLVHLYNGDLELAQPCQNLTDAWLNDQARRLPAEGTVAEGSWEWQLWLEVQILRQEAKKSEWELRWQSLK